VLCSFYYSQTKVSNFSLTIVPIDKDVFTLQVSMDDRVVSGVKVIQPVQNLFAPISDDLWLDQSFCLSDVTLQGARGHELGDKVDIILIPPGIEQILYKDEYK
jgi:hypothetical protein